MSQGESTSAAAPREASATWRFPPAFWSANFAELLERAAFYGMFISITLYLTRLVGFTDVQAGWVAGLFAGFLYFAPTFAGAVADSMGFRRALLMAFTLLALGYATLGLFATKLSAVIALLLVMAGGAFVKSVITGTVAKTSSEANRARAFSIFYGMVNIGAFTGKSLAKPLRTDVWRLIEAVTGETVAAADRMRWGLMSVNVASAIMCLVAVLLVFFLFRKLDTTGEGKSLRKTLEGFLRVVTNLRFMAIIVIVGGFWAIQHQLYATMPKYVLRMVGEQAAPEWYANVNPLVVVLMVMPITHLVRKLRPVTCIGIGLAIIPLSALTMSLSHWLEGVMGLSVGIIGDLAVHPITVMMVLGIVMQALAECFLSPRFLEYASKQAPPGEHGLYMGYSHLTSFFGNILGFGISGYLLQRWCPNPTTLSAEVQAAHAAALAGTGPMPEAYANAHHIWWVFAGIGGAAFVALLAYRAITDRVDGARPPVVTS